MALEIERKFLLSGTGYRDMAVACHRLCQFYLSARPESTVRVRISDNQNAFITIKGQTKGCTRHEWEYPIPLAEAQAMMPLAVGRVVEKIRLMVPAENGLYWEVDEFEGELTGLVLAEIELPNADAVFSRPSFLGREVTGDPQYYNSMLALSSSLPSVD